MSVKRAQSGRGGLTLLVLLIVLAVGGYVAWGFLHQTPARTVAATPADSASAQQKALSFAQGKVRARLTGRPVSVVQTFDDAELSALANQAAQAKGLAVDQISLHATGHGTVQGSAQAHAAGQSLPVTLEGVPQVSDGNRLQLHVNSVGVGAFPLPGPVAEQATQSIRGPLELGQPLTGYQDVHVTTSEGQLTVSGTATPA
jgi:hypothetical protein